MNKWEQPNDEGDYRVVVGRPTTHERGSWLLYGFGRGLLLGFRFYSKSVVVAEKVRLKTLSEIFWALQRGDVEVEVGERRIYLRARDRRVLRHAYELARMAGRHHEEFEKQT